MSTPNTTFSMIHDQLFSVIKSVLPDHKELDDNVIIENNNALKLNKGFCVEWRGGNNTKRALSGIKVSVEQQVVITTTLVNRGSETDLTARHKAEKDILTDCYKLIEAIEQNVQLDDHVEKFEFSSHNGIELILDREDKAYLMIQATYNLEWFTTKEN